MFVFKKCVKKLYSYKHYVNQYFFNRGCDIVCIKCVIAMQYLILESIVMVIIK